MFGEHFGAGYLTLVIIAVGASMSALYADISYYLQYLSLNRTVLDSTLLAMPKMVTRLFHWTKAMVR
ncbi:hypothetical protein [Methyloglobulus sp.]|uniref:hypothetical protein n=1 Tax=Methyloglobulus sp. TaxID=2518622 RepID=UPI0032B7E9BD